MHWRFEKKDLNLHKLQNQKIMKAIKIVIALLFIILAGLYTLSSRYEIQVLGKSRDACLRLDKWTGKIELIPIDSNAYQVWLAKQQDNQKQ